MRGLLLLVLALASTSVLAGTYKWVDEKGITNYSNNPPPSAKPAQKLAVVEERLSVYPSDPMLMRTAEARASRIQDQAEAEWLQRQRVMLAQQQTYQSFPGDYRDSHRYGSYYSPYVSYLSYLPLAAFPAARARPAFFSQQNRRAGRASR